MLPMPQPPVRPLDHGRLLRVRVILQPDRLQAGPGPSRADGLQHGHGRGQSPDRRPGRTAHVTRRPAPDEARPGLSQSAGRPARSRPRTRAFARTMANFVWAHSSARGSSSRFTTPGSATRRTRSEPPHALARRLVEVGFDTKPLIRDILRSRTYQLSTRRNEFNRWDDRNFSHQKIRRMVRRRGPARLHLAGYRHGRPGFRVFPGWRPRGPDPRMAGYRIIFLTTFGRSSRELVCSCEVRTTPTLSQALHLINGETTSGKIAEGKVGGAPGQDRQADRRGRRSSTNDASHARPAPRLRSRAHRSRLSAASDKVSTLQDLFWASPNSNEFLFNH